MKDIFYSYFRYIGNGGKGDVGLMGNIVGTHVNQYCTCLSL